MFGITKGCGCQMSRSEKQEWVGHVCGLCLTLREHHGQLSRFTTNFDAALLSVLCEAQSPKPFEKMSHVCPLRRFQRADVVVASNAGSQYAAAISVLMASTKIEDHIADGDNWLRFLPGFFLKFTGKWKDAARRAAGSLGFRTEVIEAQTQRQLTLERGSSRDFGFYSQATEQAVGTAFQHTAAIAECPQNANPLYQMGLMFGRIMYLLDSYRDYAVDVAAKKFNALARCFTRAEIQSKTGQIFRHAHSELTRYFNQLSLSHPDLARKLLIEQLKNTGEQTISRNASTPNSETPNGTTPENTQQTDESKKKKRRDRVGCCDGCFCCFDCCSCDCCGEEEGCCNFDCCSCNCCGEGEGCCSCDCCDCDCG
jgi:flagellar biosynthesis regulator FlbT